MSWTWRSALMHRYYDCLLFTFGDDVHQTDDDPRPVTCPECRSEMGLEP